MKNSRIPMVLSLGLLVFMFGLCSSAFSASVSVRNDIHVQPVAEFLGSGGYPDIVTLENDLLRLTCIPKRGRIIHQLILKETGHDLFYNTFTTLPMEDGKIMLYELGGMYISHPWNPRDQQPFDMDYEILSQEGDVASIRIWGVDFDTDLSTEVVLSLQEGSNVVQIDISHKNATDQALRLVFWDRFILNPGAAPDDVVLELPTDGVTIGSSRGNWMGAAGESLPWPQAFGEWKNFETTGRFTASVDLESGQAVGVANTGSGDRVTIESTNREAFSSIEVLGYGPDYRRVMGAFPGYRLTRMTPETDLEPGEVFSYTVKLHCTGSQ